MGQVFYNEGCVARHPLKWPVVAVRRLLRRLQRPFFFSLQNSLDRFDRASAGHRTDLAALASEIAALRADLSAVTTELRAIRANPAAPVPEGEQLRSDLELLSRRVATLLDNEGMHPVGLIHKLDALDRAARSAKADNFAGGGRPPRILFAVSSASQMYSGIGRAIFETTKRLRGRVEYEFAMDDGCARNLGVLSDFCREHGVRLHVGTNVRDPDTLDWGNAALRGLIRGGGWDAIECVSFASAATNGAVLEHAGDTPIVYTPHHQPMWTVPGTETVYRRIAEAHGALLRRAALVSCDTPYEWLMLQAEAGPGMNCVLLPLGIDPAAFTTGGPDRRPYLLFVGDQREMRKRFPLAVRVFAEILRRHQEYQLVVVGNKSDEMGPEITDEVRKHCVLLGYVTESELHALYRESMGLILFSDYEAFGLPIVEALACGTPVYMSRRPTVTSVFSPFKGAVLLDDDSPAAMAERVSAKLSASDFIREVLADRSRVVDAFCWDALSERRYEALRSVLAHKAHRNASAA